MILAIGIAALGPALVAAQVRHIEIESGHALAQSFSHLVGVVELGDGLVLVADQLERLVSVVDFDTGLARPLAPEGRGPNEILDPASTWPLGDGRAVIIDRGNSKLVFVAADGVIDSTRSYAQHAQFALGVDTEGRVLFPRLLRPGDPGFGTGVRALLRWDARSNSQEVMARLKTVEVRSRAEPLVALEPVDGWALASDGRLAIARAMPFRVEWVDRGEIVRSSVDLPYAPVVVSQAERDAWLETQAEAEVVFTASGDRRTLPRSAPDPGRVRFPRVLPAFDADELLVTPDGMVWIRLSASADASVVTYYELDHDARLVSDILIPASKRIIAVGSRYVYLVQEDELGLQTLERLTLR